MNLNENSNCLSILAAIKRMTECHSELLEIVIIDEVQCLILTLVTDIQYKSHILNLPFVSNGFGVFLI